MTSDASHLTRPDAEAEGLQRAIVRALERCRWKVSGPGGAAEALNLKPTTLEARMKKLGICRPGRGDAGRP